MAAVLSQLSEEVRRLSEMASEEERRARIEAESLLSTARRDADRILAEAQTNRSATAEALAAAERDRGEAARLLDEAERILSDARTRADRELQSAKDEHARLRAEAEALVGTEKSRIRSQLVAEVAAVRSSFSDAIAALDGYLEACDELRVDLRDRPESNRGAESGPASLEAAGPLLWRRS